MLPIIGLCLALAGGPPDALGAAPPDALITTFPDAIAGRIPGAPDRYSEIVFHQVRARGEAMPPGYTAAVAQVQKRIQHRFRNADGSWPLWTDKRDDWWPPRDYYFVNGVFRGTGIFHYRPDDSAVTDVLSVDIPAEYRREYLSTLEAGEPFYQIRQKVRLRYVDGNGAERDFVSAPRFATAVITGRPDQSILGGSVDLLEGLYEYRVVPYPRPKPENPAAGAPGRPDQRDTALSPHGTDRHLRTLDDVEWLRGAETVDVEGQTVIVVDRRVDRRPLSLRTKMTTPMVTIYSDVPAEFPAASFAVIGVRRAERMAHIRAVAERQKTAQFWNRYRLVGPGEAVRPSRQPLYGVMNGRRDDHVPEPGEAPQVYVSVTQFVDVPVKGGILEASFGSGGELWQYRVPEDDDPGEAAREWGLVRPLEGGGLGTFPGTTPRPRVPGADSPAADRPEPASDR